MIKTAAKSLACGLAAVLLAMQLGATGPVAAQEAEERAAVRERVAQRLAQRIAARAQEVAARARHLAEAHQARPEQLAARARHLAEAHQARAEQLVGRVRHLAEARQNFAPSFIAGGGYLGVQISDVDEEQASELGMSEPYGAYVSSVVDGSPADYAGINDGDVLVRWNGGRIESVAQLRRFAQETPEGRTVNVRVFRDGSELDLSVKLGVSRNSWSQMGSSAAPMAIHVVPDVMTRVHVAPDVMTRDWQSWTQELEEAWEDVDWEDLEEDLEATFEDLAQKFEEGWEDVDWEDLEGNLKTAFEDVDWDELKEDLKAAADKWRETADEWPDEEWANSVKAFDLRVSEDGVWTSRPSLGVEVIGVEESLGDYFGVDGGAIVTRVLEDSPAERAGALAGDVIVGVGDVEVGSPDELRAALSDREPGEVGLNIIRHGEERVLSVELEEGTGSRFFFRSSDDGPRFRSSDDGPRSVIRLRGLGSVIRI